MAILIPAIKGKLGNTDYFEATMNVRDLVQAVRPPLEMDEWANFGIEERMQREPEKGRIKAQLAPYIAKNPDRFFGSIIVLIYEGDVAFESFDKIAEDVPMAYKKNASRIGFLTIDGGSLVVLDGQHRLLALRMVLQGDVMGECSKDVPNDEACVIFIKHEEFVKTRRIFNTVNRYAKPTSRGDNILTSEDDGYAIVARRLLRDDQPLHARPNEKKDKEDIVDWKSNTLAPRSVKLTTISTVYEAVRETLRYHGHEHLPKQERPSDEDLDKYLDLCGKVWDTLITKVKAYDEALSELKKIPAMREDKATTSLLFKPAAQIALIEGIFGAIELSNSQLSLDEVASRVNLVSSWSMEASIWRDIAVKAGGKMDTTSDARERTKLLVMYLLGADGLDDKAKFKVWRSFNKARHPNEYGLWAEGKGKEPSSMDQSKLAEEMLEDLPTPTAGKQFTVADAKKAHEADPALKETA